MFGLLFLFFLGLLLRQLFTSKAFKLPKFLFQTIDDVMYGRSTYHQNDLETSILILASIIIKSNGIVNQEGLNYVRNYFINLYGKEKANQSFRKFKTLITQDICVRDICLEIKNFMPYIERIQLINFLFEIAIANGSVSHYEEVEIRKLASYLSIRQRDYLQLLTRYFNKNNTNQNDYSENYSGNYSNNYSSNSSSDYETLGLNKNATNQEIKKTYRKLVKQYHPDRLHAASDQELITAKEKFQKIQNAYQNIKNKRGF